MEFNNLIIEKKRKRVVHWHLNDESRKYAKYIWFNPDKYKISEFMNLLVYKLLFKNKDNDYLDFVLEENQYKDVERKNESSDQKGHTSKLKPIYRTPDIEKYARMFAANHFRERGYTVMEYEYPLFECDLEIMKDFYFMKVIVKGIDIQEDKLGQLNFEIDLIEMIIKMICLHCQVHWIGESDHTGEIGSIMIFLILVNYNIYNLPKLNNIERD